jgi:hypothetical protein
MNSYLQQCLKKVGEKAEVQIPNRSEYTSCFGFRFNRESPAVKGRQTVLILIHWLRTLARGTDNEAILKAALYLADKYIQPHRDTLGEIKLFEELDTLKSRFHVHYHTQEVKQLKEYSKHHIHIPKIIEQYLSSHTAVLKITHWLNETAKQSKDDAIIQAAVYLANKYLKDHRTTIDEIELYNELESYKTSHGVHYSNENIKALTEFSNGKHHEHMPSIIKNYLESHAVALEITHWLTKLSRETKDKHILHGAYYVAKKFLKEHHDTLGNIELFEKFKHSKKSHLFHSGKTDIQSLIEFSQQNEHTLLPKAIANFLREYEPIRYEGQIGYC